MTAFDFVLVGLVALVAGLCSLWAVAWLPGHGRPPDAGAGDRRRVSAALLFENDDLADAGGAGRVLFEIAPDADTDLGRIMALLDPWFPGVVAGVGALPPGSEADFPAARTPDTLLRAERGRHGLRLSLVDGPAAPAPAACEILLAALRQVRAPAETAPLPIWHEDEGGRVTWANAAARDLAAAAPAGAAALPRPDPPAGTRQGLAGPDGRTRWFDRHEISGPGGGRTVYALPADEAARAEAALRGVLQTLTRTFAHLPIGLAVFDADWRLGLFNPALSDLTGLPPAFLARRPTLHAVLDRLRELRMIPEPRDYPAWRRRLADIERTAETGHYTELWPLPSGQTFRVTGQPNTEGGVALLFENITADTARNRSLRARAEVAEAAIAALGRAVAVFAPGGARVAASAAYNSLWGDDVPPDLAAALAGWEQRTWPSPLWSDLRRPGAATPVGCPETVLMRDGRVLSVEVRALAGGGVMVAFDLPAAGPGRTPPRRGTAPPAGG